MTNAMPEEQFCDKAVDFAARLMMEKYGIEFDIVIDRMLTFCAAHMCLRDSSMMAAEHFRDIADKLDAGMFHHITGEKPPSKGH